MKKKPVIVVAALVSAVVLFTTVFMSTSDTDREIMLYNFTRVTQNFNSFMSVEQTISNYEVFKEDTVLGSTETVPSDPYLPGIAGGTSISGVIPKFDGNNLDSALAEKYGESTASSAWTTENVGGNIYVKQMQSCGKFTMISDESSNTMSGAGCMWFACSQAASTWSGTLIGVEDLLTNVGYTVTYNESIGSYTTDKPLPFIGSHSGKKFPNGNPCTVDGVLSTVGISTSDNSSIDIDKLNSGFYLVHASKDSDHLLSSGNGLQHWFLIVGTDDSGNYLIANGSGAAGKSHSCSIDYTNSKLDHCYYIEY